MAEERIGWVGAGRMGFALAERLLKAGVKLSVYNRTRAKAEPQTHRTRRAWRGIKPRAPALSWGWCGATPPPSAPAKSGKQRT